MSDPTESYSDHISEAAMFKLHPPGTFPICACPAFDEQAIHDLMRVSREVRVVTQPFPVVGLILTGSVARGEGALVVDTQLGSRWLSDLEFHVVLERSRSAPGRELDRALIDMARAINSDPPNRDRGLRVGFNSILAPQIKRLRPAIFSREMLEHGKLLWGEPAALPLPRWWQERRVDIPLLDGFRLLNNRIVQQIDARWRYEKFGGADVLHSYTLQKFWIELATSLSVFLGRYRTSYRERRAELTSHFKSNPGFLGDTGRLLVARLSDAIEVKLGRVLPPPCTNEAFDEAARAAAVVWYWETDQLLLRNSGTAGWRSILSRIRRAETYTQRIRDWARLLLNRKSSSRELVGDVSAALRAGSAANSIYAAACILDFFWNDFAVGSVQGAENIASLSNLLGIHAVPSLDARWVAAQAVVARWDRHLRFAPR
jgi:hypothetical protein